MSLEVARLCCSVVNEGFSENWRSKRSCAKSELSLYLDVYEEGKMKQRWGRGMLIYFDEQHYVKPDFGVNGGKTHQPRPEYTIVTENIISLPKMVQADSLGSEKLGKWNGNIGSFLNQCGLCEQEVREVEDNISCAR